MMDRSEQSGICRRHAVTNGWGSLGKITGLIILSVLTGLVLGLLILSMNVKGAVLGVGSGVVILIMARPDIGILLTIFCLLNLGTLGILSGPSTQITATIPKMIGLLTTLSWAVNLLFFKRRVIITKAIFTAFMFVAFALISITYSLDRETASIEALRLVTIVVFYFLIINLIRTKRLFLQALWLLVFSLFFISSLAIYQNISPATYMEAEVVEDLVERHEGAYVERSELSNGVSVRSTGTMTHPNWLALFIVMMLPLSITLFFADKRHAVKALLLAVIGVALMALVYTHTRLGVLASGVFFILMIRNGLIRLSPPAWCALCLCVLISFFFLPENFKERTFNPDHLSKSPSISYRLEVQEIGLRIFADHPIKGVGIGNYGPELLHYKNSYYQPDYPATENIGAHNMYVEVLSEGGLFGFILMGAFILFVLKDMHQGLARIRSAGDERLRVIAVALKISFLVFLFSALFLHAQEWKFWWIIAALASSLRTISLNDATDTRTVE